MNRNQIFSAQTRQQPKVQGARCPQWSFARLAVILTAHLALFIAATPVQAQANTPTKHPLLGAKAQLAILETTDLHTHILGYDYFRLKPDPSMGFDRTMSLIAQARREFANTVLLDNGDTIQGSALSDYQAQAEPIACDQTLAMYKVMNAAGYDGGGIGNHEFNYGLPFLSQATSSPMAVSGLAPLIEQKKCAGPQFPLVLANIHSAQTQLPIFQPYAIVSKNIVASPAGGATITASLKVGIIGFTPPTILQWDKRWLDQKVYAVGAKEAAERYIPIMKSQGADVVVVIAHMGLDAAPYSPDMENAAYHLAQVGGVDALLLGHSHQVFPSATSRYAPFNLPGVDKVAGTVFGVPTVMSGFWGKSLGVIALQLVHDGRAWVVDKAATKVEQRSTQKPGGAGQPRFVEPDPTVAEMIAAEHAATIAYVKTPLGTSSFRLSSLFADVGDVSAIQIVNMAQTEYLKRQVKDGLPQWAHLPVLSMSAPFKAGFGGSNDYTDVPAGGLALNNAADLYLYPNTLHGVKVNGAELRAWLEQSAKRFNRIDPNKTEIQQLVSNVPSYNFDMLTHADIRYTIDVSQPVGKRIAEFTWAGQAVSPTQEFLIATNNYRASGGGNFPGLDGSKTVFSGPDTNQAVLIEHLRRVKQINAATHGSTRSWRFAALPIKGPVVFRSAAGQLAVAHAAGLTNINVHQADDASGGGMGLYAIDLSR